MAVAVVRSVVVPPTAGTAAMFQSEPAFPLCMLNRMVDPSGEYVGIHTEESSPGQGQGALIRSVRVHQPDAQLVLATAARS